MSSVKETASRRRDFTFIRSFNYTGNHFARWPSVLITVFRNIDNQSIIQLVGRAKKQATHHISCKSQVSSSRHQVPE